MKSEHQNLNYFFSKPGHALFVLVFSAAICLVLTAAGCGKKKAETTPQEVIRPVKTMTVASGEGVSGLTFPGRVRASQRV